MRTHTLRNVNKHRCHSKVNVKKGEKKKKRSPEDFHVQIPDRMISHLRSAPSEPPPSAAAASKRERCLFAQSHRMRLILAEIWPNCFSSAQFFFNGFPNSLIMLDCALQFESQKIGIARIFSLSICPLCLPVGLARFSPPSITHLNYPRVYIVPQSITEQPPFSTGVYICTETSENIQARRRRTLR